MHQNYQKAIDGQVTIELVKSHNNKSYCTCRKQQSQFSGGGPRRVDKQKRSHRSKEWPASKIIWQVKNKSTDQGHHCHKEFSL